MNDTLEKLMPDQFRAGSGVERLSDSEQAALTHWAAWLCSLGRRLVASIDEVKYDGHVVLLDDGTRWEVDDLDTFMASMWSFVDKVLIVDGEMWKLDESEKVSVTEDS